MRTLAFVKKPSKRFFLVVNLKVFPNSTTQGHFLTAAKFVKMLEKCQNSAKFEMKNFDFSFGCVGPLWTRARVRFEFTFDLYIYA